MKSNSLQIKIVINDIPDHYIENQDDSRLFEYVKDHTQELVECLEGNLIGLDVVLDVDLPLPE